ncbi:hypothetical protein DFH08DRAFT_1087589 [Mycena albidolilacea]|uniref:Uncharacterized protein n=1 Tax=Mycena albidolilacea TaxID=1033008 RepID=A0AAD6Z9B7_9AGAR|nr:hypothetical protein DFH08DRAFT_1087589 [Mycena albidolilacea]
MAEITPLSETHFSFKTFSITLPTFNTLASERVSFLTFPSLAHPTFNTLTSEVVSALPSLTLPTINNPNPTEFSGPTTTRSSDPTTTRSSDPIMTRSSDQNLDPTGLSDPASTFTLALPTFNNPSYSGFSGPATTYHISIEIPTFSPSGLPGSQTTGSTAPVSSVLTAYGPVSTVVSTSLQTSFSAISVGSNILAAEVFLYGAYFVMFGFYLNVLRVYGAARNRSLTIATAMLFIFCTAHCALQITTTTLYNQLVSTSLEDSKPVFDRTFKDYSALAIATNAVYVTSNMIADSIFILRCYAIWNFQLKIIIFPVLLTLAVAGVGYTNAFWPLHIPSSLRSPSLVVAEFSFKLLKISTLLSIFTTVILMVLTAGRIWWMARTARTLLGRTVTRKYYTACAMILESGVITCASAIAFAAIGFTLDPIYSTTGAVLGQLVFEQGIAPTIIAVRVGLGRSVDNVESFVAAQGGDYTPPFNNTTSARSLERPGTILYIRSDT